MLQSFFREVQLQVSTQAPGPRRRFRSISVHLQVLMNLVDIFVPALLRDDRRPGQGPRDVQILVAAAVQVPGDSSDS